MPNYFERTKGVNEILRNFGKNIFNTNGFGLWCMK